MNKLFKLFSLLLFLSFSMPVLAQVNPQNLSNIRVDELSDDQVRAFMRQVEASGLGEAQLEQIAQSRGMRPEEVKKLRERVDKLKKGDKKGQDQADPNKVNTKKNTDGRSFEAEQDSISIEKDPETEAEKALLELRSKIFGADLFKNKNQTFEPNLNIATPKGYVIGANDQLLIDLTGNSEVSYDLKVSPEGTIKVEYVGIIPVAGLTIEAATTRIKSRMATVYAGLSSGNTRLNVAIGNIRSIKVILTGEVKTPGTYTLPSLATVFNALYSSGGPTENGSFRAIELIRSGKKIAVLDIYEFLMKGEIATNLKLQDQDIIRIPVYQSRIEIVGEVKRPGIYELKAGESYANLLNYAGGFTENAYQARVKVLKNTDTERKIADIAKEQFASYQPATGDKYFVDRVLERFTNRVQIEGAVFRPGAYELESGMKLSQLIQKADGLKEDAFLSRGYLTRLKADNQTQLISFDVAAIISGKTPDIQLQREDLISISSIFDLQEEFKVSIDGEVREPGEFDYAQNMTVEELIIQAGGFSESASPQRVEISRRVRSSDQNSELSKTAEVFLIDIDKNLNFSKPKFELQPFDIVSVRSSMGYEIQRQVKVEGEVLYPGMYTISNKNERVSDLVERAGGLTALAYAKGASLKREGITKVKGLDKDDAKAQQELAEEEKQKVNKLKRLQENAVDTTNVSLKDEEVLKNVYVGINLEKILEAPKSSADLILEEGDVLRIPKELQTVKVNGAVLYPVTTSYTEGKKFKYYVSQGGGFSEKSVPKRSYVIYANGSVRSTRKVFLFNNYPSIDPGSEVFVPKKEAKRPISAGEIVGISSALASMAVIILNLVK
ncbi:SLBB domain-containing protein [Daejeonella sp.]|jgi:protein involved in polysaccharide export with SLBB domain|uniref:SLBB domain-containing protein n=1 Tax=Daejeonella sp. TaxID=2805397 RepID=UPI0037BE2F32